MADAGFRKGEGRLGVWEPLVRLMAKPQKWRSGADQPQLGSFAYPTDNYVASNFAYNGVKFPDKWAASPPLQPFFESAIFYILFTRRLRRNSIEMKPEAGRSSLQTIRYALSKVYGM